MVRAKIPIGELVAQARKRPLINKSQKGGYVFKIYTEKDAGAAKRMTFCANAGNLNRENSITCRIAVATRKGLVR